MSVDARCARHRAKAGALFGACAILGLSLAACGDTTIVQTVKTVARPADGVDRTVHVGDQFHGPTLVAPRQLSLWVSDALVRLQWRDWGQPTATATGKVTEHPGGNYRYLPASVVAGGIGRCGGRVIYTRLSYRAFGKWHDAELQNCRFSAAVDDGPAAAAVAETCQPVDVSPEPSTVKAINIGCDQARELVRTLTFDGQPPPGWVWLNPAGCEGFIVRADDKQAFIDGNYEAAAGMPVVPASVFRGCTS